jgi:HK97 gp10 family phage protein
MARRDSWLLVDVTLKEGFTDLLNTFNIKTEDALYLFGQDVRDAAEPPIETRALKESGSVYTRRKSDFRRRVSKARSRRPEARFATPIKPRENTVHIHWPIHYATYIELGTRFRPAKPFALPAMDKMSKRNLRHFVEEYQRKLLFKKVVFRVR